METELEKNERLYKSEVNTLDKQGSMKEVMPRFLFRYKCLDENFKVEIEAENLNKAMFNFATYYHQVQEIYSVVRVP
jgi:hypothetical protein